MLHVRPERTLAGVVRARPRSFDLATIALWLGHASLQSTNLYVHADMALESMSSSRSAATSLARSPRRANIVTIAKSRRGAGALEVGMGHLGAGHCGTAHEPGKRSVPGSVGRAARAPTRSGLSADGAGPAGEEAEEVGEQLEMLPSGAAIRHAAGHDLFAPDAFAPPVGTTAKCRGFSVSPERLVFARPATRKLPLAQQEQRPDDQCQYRCREGHEGPVPMAAKQHQRHRYTEDGRDH
jgi:hypothetical protein